MPGRGSTGYIEVNKKGDEKVGTFEILLYST
jgi:hypothetical protein